MPLRDADLKQFSSMLTSVAALYGRELSEGVIALYFRALREYDLAAVRESFDRHVRNPDSGQFFPKPADLVRMIGGTSQDSALIAWATVERAISRVGGHESVSFEDPITMRVIYDMGGWVRLCDMRTDELEHQQREFVSRYRGFVSRSDLTPACPQHLAGRIEASNGARFAEFTPAVVYIAGGLPRTGNGNVAPALGVQAPLKPVEAA